jgi:hypothetical protein
MEDVETGEEDDSAAMSWDGSDGDEGGLRDIPVTATFVVLIAM